MCVLNKHKAKNVHALPPQGTGNARHKCLRDEVFLSVLPSGALHHIERQIVTISMVMLDIYLNNNAPFPPEGIPALT
jgi:hypothetical protein